MIERPKGEDFRDRAVVAALREGAELAGEATAPVRAGLSATGKAAALYLLPMIFVPVLIVLRGRWPDFFGSAAGLYGVVAAFGVTAWYWITKPAVLNKTAARRARIADWEDTASTRSALLHSETGWII